MNKPIADRESIERGLQRLFKDPLTALLTVVGLVGVLVGMILALLEVKVGSGLDAAGCGSVFVPVQNFSGATEGCGEPLSVAAIRSATLVLGGAGLVAHSLLNKGFNRALLILSLTLVVALALNFFEPSGGWYDFLFMIYAVVLGIFTWRRGMGR